MFSFTEYFSTKVYGQNTEQANIYFDNIPLEYVKHFEERTRQHMTEVNSIPKRWKDIFGQMRSII